jgi:hypothetical protein
MRGHRSDCGANREIDNFQFRVVKPEGKAARPIPIGSGASGEMDLQGTRAQLVFVVGSSHGHAAPHFFQAQHGVVGKVEGAIEQQVLAVRDRKW